MTATNTKDVLHKALDASAPDGESWLKGEEGFDNASNEQLGYIAALDLSAPDEEHWQAGYGVLRDAGVLEEYTDTVNENDRHWSSKLSGEAILAVLIGLLIGTIAGALLVWLTTAWWTGPINAGFANSAIMILTIAIGGLGAYVVLKFIRRKHGYYTPEGVDENDS